MPHPLIVTGFDARLIAILALLPATLPRVSDHAMHDDEGRRQVHRAETQPPTTFSTSVAPTNRGEWLTIVDLGSGITMSRLFDCEDDALRYGDELADWLRRGAGE